MTCLRPLLPNTSISPRSLGITLCWSVVLSLLFCFLVFMPGGLLNGMDLQGFTALYTGAAVVTVQSALAVLLPIWLFYTYIYLLANSVVAPIRRGRLPVHVILIATSTAAHTKRGRFITRALLFAVASILRIVLSALAACERALPLSWRWSGLHTSPLKAHAAAGLPTHLATGWSAGFSPQVLYS